MKFASHIVGTILVSLLVLGSPVLAGITPDDNILADIGKVKPSIRFSEVYSEKMRPGHALEVSAPIKATIVANFEGVDTSNFGSHTEVGVAFGGMAFTAPLYASLEAKATGEVFPKGTTKATFLLTYQEEVAPGNIVSRTGGKVTFNWSRGRLVVKVNCKPTHKLTVGQAAAPDYKGLYEDESPSGNRPAGSVKFSGKPELCTVYIGYIGGYRYANISGISSTKVKKIGRGDEAREVLLETVRLKGVIGDLPPLD